MPQNPTVEEGFGLRITQQFRSPRYRGQLAILNATSNDDTETCSGIEYSLDYPDSGADPIFFVSTLEKAQAALASPGVWYASSPQHPVISSDIFRPGDLEIVRIRRTVEVMPLYNSGQTK